MELNRFSSALNQRPVVRSELGLTDSTLVFGHVGRFVEQKNHQYLLEIFARIHALFQNSVLLLVGEGVLRSKMEQKARDLGIENSVYFLGLRQDIPYILAAMDCFVFPSLHEGLPVTMIEAQAAGLPILASSTITQEVCVTPLVQLMDLETPAEEWAKAALSMALAGRNQRSCPIRELTDAGYDIRYTAKKLEEFYLGLYSAL
ncbi:Glycosyltransferase [gut metagenome]|uniref:Glycosyltransferase n=1 Tax=gut metagenome TaxID=749906 RepID=J9GGQ1_9ZZZZ